MENCENTSGRIHVGRVASWYCANCGTRISAVSDSSGRFRNRCKNCGAMLEQKVIGRRHAVIEIYIK